MDAGTLVAIAVCISLAVFVVTWPGIVLFSMAKAFVLRKSMPEAEDIPFATWLNDHLLHIDLFWHIDYFLNVFVATILLFLAQIALILAINVPVIRWIVISGLLVTGALHALRWGFDVKREVNKIKETPDEEEQA